MDGTTESTPPSREMREGIARLLSKLGKRTGEVDQQREKSAAFAPPADDTSMVSAVDAGGVPAEWVWADGVAEGRAVICLHYGGYVAGNAATLRPFEVTLSRQANARFLGLDYRLAPEHPYPAAVEDVVAAYRWVLESGLEPRTVAFGGASAGGGLALAALVAVRDAGLPQPGAAFALSPWTDMTLTSTTMTAAGSPDPISTLAEFQHLVKVVLVDADPHAPLASPLFADLSGLPPIHVEVGTAERLLDDSQKFVAAARRAGTHAQLQIVEGAIHCFPLHVPDAPESDAAISRISGFLDERLA